LHSALCRLLAPCQANKSFVFEPFKFPETRYQGLHVIDYNILQMQFLVNCLAV